MATTTKTTAIQVRPVERRLPARRVVMAPAPTKRRRRSGGGMMSGGGNGIAGTGITLQRAGIAYLLGSLQRQGQLLRIPGIAMLGAEGTISLVAGMMGGSNPLAKDIALISGVVALNHVGRLGVEGAEAEERTRRARAAADAARPVEPGVSGSDPYAVQGDGDHDD